MNNTNDSGTLKVNQDLNKYTPNEAFGQFNGAKKDTEGIKTPEPPKTFTAEEDLKSLAQALLKKEDPCAKFDVSLLPELLKDYISSICETTAAHPIMITCTVLATVSAILKKRVYIPEGEFFQELYPNLWLLNIANSGQRKTTSLNKGARLAYNIDAKINTEIRQLNTQLTHAEKKYAAQIQESIAKLSLESVILPDKITSEGLMEHLSEGHAGVILVSEMASWLQNLNKNHNNDLKSIFTDYYDVPQSRRYKTKTQGDYIIEKPYISISGLSTSSWLKSNIKSDDVSSGFLGRFLIFSPPQNNERPPSLPQKTTSTTSEHETKILELLNKVGEAKVYKLSESAKAQYDIMDLYLFNTLKSLDDRYQEKLEPFFNRWSPYILKLAMMIRIFEDVESDEISDSSIHTAMMIVNVAVKSTIQLFQGELGESEHERKCNKLFDWLCKQVVKTKGAPVPRHTIIRSSQVEGDTKQYDSVLETLAQSNRIEIIKPKDTAGNPLGISKWLYLPIDPK